MGNYFQKITGLFLAAFILTISSVWAQAPLGFNYQGVALTNAGTPVSNTVISLRISLIESQQLGTTRFQETHNVNTDAYGQFSVTIGNGQAVIGKMSDVQWSKFPYYMKVELDLKGGTAFVLVGTSQLLSVPYALYANNAGAASISVDSINNELATIRLVQRGDSIFLNNNRGGAFIPKIDSLTKITSQLSSINKALNNIIDSLVTALSTKTYVRIDSSSLFIADPVIVTKFLDSTFLPTINFDGSKSYINIGSTSLASRLSSSNLTFEFWIKNTLKNNVNQTIFSTGYDLQGQGINVNLNNGKLTFSFSNFNHQISLDYPNDSSWHHVAYTNKEKSVSIVYLDGVEKMRANNTGLNISSSQRLAIGATILGTSPTEFYKGSLRKMRISKGISYTSNFTPSYTYTKADSTIAFWELNDLGTRIKANDSAYNGTLYNGTWIVPDTSSVRLSFGLVAYYPFSGNAKDSSTSNLNGVITGATLTNDRFGNANKAYKFSGNSINDNTVVVKDEFIKVSNFNTDFSNKISISLWANVDSTNYGGFLQRRVDNNIDFAVSSYGGSSGTRPDPNTISWSIGGNRTNLGKTVIPYKTWHNYIYIFDGTSMKTYLDGILETQTAATGLISNNSSDLFIGKYIYNGGKTHHFYYNGSMDDVRIYNRVLNSNEINALSTENGAPLTLKIGDSYGGGFVAYIYQPSDSGYIAGQVHGIIAAKTDQGTASWGCEGILIGTANGLGKGKFNTEQIIAKCSDTATAAKVCRALTLNGYSDWYFPSLDEMKQLRLNLHLKGLGNFRTDLSYFASTETSASTAYEFYISSAATGGINKQGNKMAVRAVRYF